MMPARIVVPWQDEHKSSGEFWPWEFFGDPLTLGVDDFSLLAAGWNDCGFPERLDLGSIEIDRELLMRSL